MLHARTLRWSAWLGWQLDTNWASPWLFALYVLIKPLAGALVLVCMYWAVQAAAPQTVARGFLPFLYVSNACFMVIGGVTFGMCQAVVADRDSYGMLKYIRISPAPFRSYLIGRGLSRTGQAVLGALLTLGVGLLLFPEVRAVLRPNPAAWVWLPCYLVLGALMLLALGLLLAGTVLNMARYGMFLSEGIAGMLYLLSGAVFPLDVLPAWLRPVSLVLPPTYWLEGMRRCLLGQERVPTCLADWGQGQLVVALLVSTLMLAAAAHWLFRWSEQRAWRLGRFDQVSGY